MSSKNLFAAVKSKVGNAQQKLILIAMADISNEKNQCWPSHNYLGEVAECSRSSVIRHLSALEEKGFIKIENRTEKGIKTSNLYTLTMCQSDTSDVSICYKGSVTVTHNTLIDTPIKHICSNWPDWVDHRKQMKKPLTKKTIEMQTKFLQKFDEQTRVKIIEQSIFKGWAGLFELKGDRYEAGKPNYRLSAVERVQQANLRRAKERAALQNGNRGDVNQGGVTLGADDGVVWEQVD